MGRSIKLEDLSIDELHFLLMEKRRLERNERIDRFRRYGRLQPVITGGDKKDTGAILRTIASQSAGTNRQNKPVQTPRRKFVDRLLLFIEILAVAALFYVLWNGVNLLRNLNKEVAASLVQPTITPTALITAVVLPSGHTPPNAPGGVQPNESEIPDHLRPLVQSMAALPLPTSSPEQAVRVQIPGIHVDAPIVQGDGWDQLKKGVGQYIGSPNPGQKGNLVLSAHNDVFGEIFRDLDQLKQGEQLTVYTNQKSYVYTIDQTRIVEPTQVEVMAPSPDAMVTLISCYPYMINNKRIVVTATLQN